MKKRLILSILALGFSLLSNNQSKEVNADVDVSETILYSQMVDNIISNNGKTYTGASLVDYSIMHGDVINNNILEFDTSNETLGTSTDNAYFENNWKCYSKNNEGVIAVILAKENITVSTSWTTSGWVENGKFGLFKKENNSIVTIVDEEVTSNNKNTIFKLDNISLKKGDTLYYQYKFEWTDYRNMQDLQAFSFIFAKDDSVLIKEPVTKQASLYMGDMIIATGNASGNVTAAELANYTIKHGNVATNNIQSFTSYGQTSEATMQLGNDNNSAYAKNWALYTSNNDGIIAEINANFNVKINVSLNSVQGWPDDCKIELYKRTNDEITCIKSTKVFTTSQTSDFEATINLSAGETLYYQFIFEWDGHRNLQIDLPSFNISYIEANQHAINQINSYMNLAYKYSFKIEDNTTTFTKSEFRIQVGVDSSIVDISTNWGIEVKTQNKTHMFDDVTKTDGDIKYVVIGLGDVINNITYATEVFNVRAYVIIDGTTYYSEQVKSYSVASMLKEYKSQGKNVDRLYTVFEDLGLYN